MQTKHNYIQSPRTIDLGQLSLVVAVAQRQMPLTARVKMHSWTCPKSPNYPRQNATICLHRPHLWQSSF